MARKRVLLADGSTFMRVMLRNALETLSIEVVSIAKNAEEAVDGYTETRPDLALIDLGLGPGMGGIEVVRALVKEDPAAAIIGLVPEHMDDPDLIVEAVRAGVGAYIRKPVSASELKARIERTLKGG